jgi:hypothetical protein
MQALDWQEQEHRATEIREILERTLTLVQSAGLMEWSGNGWLYQGEEQTLFYNPDSDQLSVFNNDGFWHLSWHEALFIPDAGTQISNAQLEEFRELGRWLDTQNELQTLDYSGSLTTAARLFEQYAADGETAFKTSVESSEHFYRIEVDETSYWISRDDVTGTYSLQREDGVPLAESDNALWADIDWWLEELDRAQSQLPTTFPEAPYWEQQTLWANQLLPQAEYVFAFHTAQNDLHYDSITQSYLAETGDYQVGYSSLIDRFWIDREGERIISIDQYSQLQGNENWNLPQLNDLGEMKPTDISWFSAWSNWLQLKAEQMEVLPNLEASLNRLWERDRSPLVNMEQEFLQEKHSDDYDYDR